MLSIRKRKLSQRYRDKVTPDAKIKGMLDAYVADVGPILSEVIGTTPTMISRTTNASGESAMGI